MGNLDFSANADQLRELAAYMASQINVPTIGISGGYAPIGSINFFDATTAPQDWLACDGTVYNIADYPQLADWYEAQHGSKNFYGGNGTTTFAVPDLQGEFLRGTGTNSHTNQGSGANVGVHQDSTTMFQTYNDNTNPFIYPHYGNTIMNSDGSSAIQQYAYKLSATKVESTNSSATNFRPTNTSFLICVKAVVAGEVYSTDERVVGTWIDGKPIYQKTINFGKLPNATTKSVGTGVTNIDRVINIQSYCYSAQLDTVILNDVSADSYNTHTRIKYTKSTNTIDVNSNGDRSSWSAYITIRYTKTTDV